MGLSISPKLKKISPCETLVISIVEGMNPHKFLFTSIFALEHMRKLIVSIAMLSSPPK